MTFQRQRISRRAALAGMGGLTLAAGVLPSLRAQQRFRPPNEAIPITGKAGPGLEPFDAAMIQIMERHGIPGAALAVAKDGKLALAKGYGWANVATGEAVRPDTLFGLASVSKAITAVAALKLVEQGKLGLNDRVFDILKQIPIPPGRRPDPRLGSITVHQCLNHSGGWDRAIGGDPINWEPQICRAFGVAPPLSPWQFISFVLGRPLDFDPGTEAKYSNVGYIILGEVIARISGQSYDRFVVENVFKPVGIARAGMHALDGTYVPKEARRHLAGTQMVLPPLRLPMAEATGGWISSGVDLVRFLTNLDGSRGQPILGEKIRKAMVAPPPAPIQPRADGTYFGLGWDSVLVKDKAVAYFKNGSNPGMRTFIKRLPTGVNWALLYNASMEFDPVDVQIVAGTVQQIHGLIERLDKFPAVDFFKEFA